MIVPFPFVIKSYTQMLNEDQYTVPRHPVRIGHHPVFGQGHHLVRGRGHPVHEPHGLRVVVPGIGVNVLADDVAAVIPHVPVGVLPVPDPDEVVELMVMGLPFIHQVPQPLVSILAPAAPPEPTAGRFVKGPPQHCHVVVLQDLELFRNRVDVPDQVPCFHGDRARVGQPPHLIGRPAGDIDAGHGTGQIK